MPTYRRRTAKDEPLDSTEARHERGKTYTPLSSKITRTLAALLFLCMMILAIRSTYFSFRKMAPSIPMMTSDYANPQNVYPPLEYIVLGDLNGHHEQQQPFTINRNFRHDSANGFATIDILSTGSTKRLNYLKTQAKSWASHVSVRNFWGVTERNDLDPNCTQPMISQATEKHFQKCMTTMANPTTDSNIMSLFRKIFFLASGKRGPGWLCAQVRFGQALGKVGAEYRRHIRESIAAEEVRDFDDLLHLHADILPDYLLLVDDDSYVNLDLFQTVVKNATTSAMMGGNDYASGLHEDVHKPLVYAGCVSPKKSELANFTTYTGGFGVILSKGTVARMIHPIFCEKWKKRDGERDDIKLSQVQDFEWKVCKRIEENIIGEKGRFVDGMTITDLSFELSNSANAMCMFSDTLQSYLLSYYFLSDHESPEISMTQDEGSRIVPFLGRGGVNGTCKNTKFGCNESKHICHYQTPDQMTNLTRTIRSKLPEAFRLND